MNERDCTIIETLFDICTTKDMIGHALRQVEGRETECSDSTCERRSFVVIRALGEMCGPHNGGKIWMGQGSGNVENNWVWPISVFQNIGNFYRIFYFKNAMEVRQALYT